MRQAGETGNSLKMVFRNHPENGSRFRIYLRPDTRRNLRF